MGAADGRGRATGGREDEADRRTAPTAADAGRMGRPQQVAAMGRARGALSAALGRQLVDGRRPKKRISGGCGGDAPHPNPTCSDTMLPLEKMTKNGESKIQCYGCLYVQQWPYGPREEYGPWA